MCFSIFPLHFCQHIFCHLFALALIQSSSDRYTRIPDTCRPARCAPANSAFVLLLHRPHVSQRFLFAFMNFDVICCWKSFEYRIFRYLYWFPFYCGRSHWTLCVFCALWMVSWRVPHLIDCHRKHRKKKKKRKTKRNEMKGRKKLNVIDFISDVNFFEIFCVVSVLFLHQQQQHPIQASCSRDTAHID